MKFKIVLLPILFAIIFAGCGNNEEQKPRAQMDPNSHEVYVKEVLQAKSYTYLYVEDWDDFYWIAIAKNQVKVGETLYYKDALEMNNFRSEDLDRTFDKVMFIDELRKEPYTISAPVMATSPKAAAGKNLDISIEPAEGGITIAELYSNKSDYENKTVIISGQVTKFNANIMGKNWVHIQDGTEFGENFDLTVTTDTEVKVGQKVIFEGSITLDKDFGSGYKYDVLMELAKFVK